MPDQTIPPRVWTELPNGAGTVLNETDANATVTIEDGEIRFSAPMRWRPTIEMSKAEDTLKVLHYDDSFNIDEIKFCVITHGSRYVGGPNLEKLPDSEDDRYWPFEKAEIIVVGENGREPFGNGRKPGKWDVGSEEFDTLAQATACREAVLNGTWGRHTERGYWTDPEVEAAVRRG